MTRQFFLTLLLLGTLASLSSAALPRITIKGQRMFDDTGKQFFCRGVAYAPSETSLTNSPLTDFTALTRDIPIFKQLNVNCIRVYQFFVNSDVQAGMRALDAAGIYLLIDLFDPTDNVNRADPIWTTDLYTVNKAKVDRVLNYTNLLGIIVGNEVTNEIANARASAYVKAAIRDVKSYIATKNVSIPVGYAGADDALIRDNLQAFFACGDVKERADFFGINIYRWCGNDLTFQSSSYDQFTQDYSTYPIPTILTEFGCIIQGGERFERQFTEVATLFGPQMNGVFSGGIAYEYHTSGSELRPEGSYGIVSYSVDGSTATLEAEGTYLSQQYNNVKNTTGSQTRDQYTPTNPSPACPAFSDATWAVTASPLPPTPDVTRCQCLNNQFKCRTKIQNPALITDDYGSSIGRVIGSICGTNATLCTSIASDAATASYGTWSMCGSLVRASLVMNYVYQSTGSCDFSEGADFSEIVEPTVYTQCTNNYSQDTADLSQVITPPSSVPVNPEDDGGSVGGATNAPTLAPTTPAPVVPKTTTALTGTVTTPQNAESSDSPLGGQTVPISCATNFAIGSILIIGLIASL